MTLITIQTSQTTTSSTKKPLTSATSANLMPEQDVITDIINEYEIERGKSTWLFWSLSAQNLLKKPKKSSLNGKNRQNTKFCW